MAITEKQLAYLKKLGAKEEEIKTLTDVRSASILITILKTEKRINAQKNAQSEKLVGDLSQKTEKCVPIETKKDVDSTEIAIKVINAIDSLKLTDAERLSIKLDAYLDTIRVKKTDISKALTLNEIKTNIKTEKKTKNDARIDRCIKHSQLQDSNIKKYSYAYDGCQYYSDGLIGVMLKDTDKLPISECPKDIKYPIDSIKKLFTNTECNESFKIDVTKITSTKEKTILLNEKYTIDISRFKTLMDYLNLSKYDSIVITPINDTILCTENKNGSKGIILTR